MAETKTASWKNCSVVLSFCFGSPLFPHTSMGAHGSTFLSLNDEFKPQPSSTPYVHAPSGSINTKKKYFNHIPSTPHPLLWDLISICSPVISLFLTPKPCPDPTSNGSSCTERQHGSDVLFQLLVHAFILSDYLSLASEDRGVGGKWEVS